MHAASDEVLDEADALDEPLRPLPFPPVTKAHILNCSYHAWYPRYRSLTPRSRLIPLPAAFLTYLRADGIMLPPEDDEDDWTPQEATILSSPPITPPTSVSDQSDAESDTSDPDPSLPWRETHTLIKEAITNLGGSVMPKLNWSAPKDAYWISATNNMDCQTANDVYLLLKSSDFVVHDLEQVFDGVADNDNDTERSVEADTQQQIPYHLVLRRTFTPTLNPALEFRCFVRSRRLLCLTQRDLNYFDFLPALVPKLRSLIEDFFDKNLKPDFPDPNFAFDVYIPGPKHERVWLIDINPWAERTDPLLFSWREILEQEDPPIPSEINEKEERVADIRLNFHEKGKDDDVENQTADLKEDDNYGTDDDDEDEDSDVSDEPWKPEFRLVHRDDPEAYAFNTPKYSAHKLPKDVVDAGGVGEGGIREFLGRWRELERRQGAN